MRQPSKTSHSKAAAWQQNIRKGDSHAKPSNWSISVHQIEISNITWIYMDKRKGPKFGTPQIIQFFVILNGKSTCLRYPQILRILQQSAKNNRPLRRKTDPSVKVWRLCRIPGAMTKNIKNTPKPSKPLWRCQCSASCAVLCQSLFLILDSLNIFGASAFGARVAASATGAWVSLRSFHEKSNETCLENGWICVACSSTGAYPRVSYSSKRPPHFRWGPSVGKSQACSVSNSRNMKHKKKGVTNVFTSTQYCNWCYLGLETY